MMDLQNKFLGEDWVNKKIKIQIALYRKQNRFYQSNRI